MKLPFFYINPEAASATEIELDEENSRHVVQVLRMMTGESLHLTDGKGQLINARITEAHKKHCLVRVESRERSAPPDRKITLGMSLLRNMGRFEWFLEKAAELGVSHIIPLVCQRTEKERSRMERLKGICISAMLQSRQCWLPQLDEATSFEKALPVINAASKFIGYCDDSVSRKSLPSFSPFPDAAMLVGPEGDFTPEEFQQALVQGFVAVSLGDTRLRSETAGIVAATILMNV